MSPTSLLLKDALLYMNNITTILDYAVLFVMLTVKCFCLPFAPLSSEKLTELSEFNSF